MSNIQEDAIALERLSQKDNNEDVVEVEKADVDIADSEEGTRLSTGKIVTLAAGMMMTFFIGVSDFSLV